MTRPDPGKQTLEARDPQVRIVRDFAAPRAQVFRAWSEAGHLRRWHAPAGCELTVCEVDFRVGGSLRTCLRTPDGSECWCRGTYLEIRAPERIVYTLANTDPAGNAVEPASIAKDVEWPRETTISVEFAELPDGDTRLTLRQSVATSIAIRTGAHPSWLSMLDRLVGAWGG